MTMPNFFINAFYENKFKDCFFVVKAGGKIVEDEHALDNLLANIRELTQIGVKVLLIYGGGGAMDAEAEKRGISVEKTGGKRITDAANMQVVQHVLGGDLSLRMAGAIAREKLEGLSFNCIPAGWMNVSLQPKTPEDVYTGGINSVTSRPIKRLFKSTNFVACACLTSTPDGVICNINADTIATQIAIGMQADKLVFLSDVDGVRINGEIASLITAEEIPGHIAAGDIQGGMQVKLENCADALSAGVRRIHLINGLREDALKKEILEPVGPGTMLIQASEEQSYRNEIEAQKLLGGQG